MGNSKLEKGTWGYIEEWKKKKLITIFLWALFILAFIGIPELIFHSRDNAFTIAGLVMVLPAAREVVQYISMLKFHSGSKEEYMAVEEIVRGKDWLLLLADIVAAGETGHMVLNMAVICNGNIYGYAPKQSKSRDEIEACLTDILSGENSYKRPVVHEDFREFEEMVMMLAANEPSRPSEIHCISERIKAVSM